MFSKFRSKSSATTSQDQLQRLREKINALMSAVANRKNQVASLGQSTSESMQVESTQTKYMNERHIQEICDGLIEYVNTYFKKQKWTNDFIKQVNQIKASSTDQIIKLNTVFDLVAKTIPMRENACTCLEHAKLLKLYHDQINTQEKAREAASTKFTEYAAVATPVIDRLAQLTEKNEALKLEREKFLPNPDVIASIKTEINKSYTNLSKTVSVSAEHEDTLKFLTESYSTINDLANMASGFVDRGLLNIDSEIEAIKTISNKPTEQFLKIKAIRDKHLAARQQNSLHAQPSTSTSQSTASQPKKPVVSK